MQHTKVQHSTAPFRSTIATCKCNQCYEKLSGNGDNDDDDDDDDCDYNYDYDKNRGKSQWPHQVHSEENVYAKGRS